jgi:hypothetical protein
MLCRLLHRGQQCPCQLYHMTRAARHTFKSKSNTHLLRQGGSPTWRPCPFHKLQHRRFVLYHCRVTQHKKTTTQRRAMRQLMHIALLHRAGNHP